jgi:hypothetical protein
MLYFLRDGTPNTTNKAEKLYWYKGWPQPKTQTTIKNNMAETLYLYSMLSATITRVGATKLVPGYTTTRKHDLHRQWLTKTDSASAGCSYYFSKTSSASAGCSYYFSKTSSTTRDGVENPLPAIWQHSSPLKQGHYLPLPSTYHYLDQ